jgi:hypothetical protein
MRNNRTNNYYPQGYLGKIAYHMFKGNFAEVQYFSKRQVQTYGDISEEDDRMINRLVIDLRRQQAAEEREFQSHLGRF